MNRRLVRTVLDRGIRVLILANFVVVAALLTLLLLDRLQSPAGRPAQLDPLPSPAAAIDLMPMGLAHIPTSNSCLLCHETGGEAGLKPVPALGHPLDGWTRCVTCHTDERLGRTAPGHTGIEEAECANCHKVAPPGPLITQAHARLEQPCLDCHGSVAHLPSSMVGRNQDECWLCHKPAPEPPPRYPHTEEMRYVCTTCHRSEDVGALPIDHALRSERTCLLCHDWPQPTLRPAPGS